MSNNRKEFDPEGEIPIVGMAEKNTTSMEALTKIAANYPSQAEEIIKILNDMNIRGLQIVFAYKTLHNKDIACFVKDILKRSKGMVDYVNNTSLRLQIPHKAVTKGALNNRQFLTT